jgi:hypothetical protein
MRRGRRRVVRGPFAGHTWGVSDGPLQTPDPSAHAAPIPARRDADVPKQYAVVLAATTILVMSLLGRHDDTRGPLWHAMILGSLVIVLASVIGAVAKRLSRPR